MDFSGAITTAAANDVGRLWWDRYNPYGPNNNLSADGTLANLTSVGLQVVENHPSSISKTASCACRPEPW
jgi:hypothetical protein